MPITLRQKQRQTKLRMTNSPEELRVSPDMLNGSNPLTWSLGIKIIEVASRSTNCLSQKAWKMIRGLLPIAKRGAYPL